MISNLGVRRCIVAFDTFIPSTPKESKEWKTTMHRRTPRFVLFAALLNVASLAADDWPQWRGPGRNGLVEKSPAIVNSLAAQSPMWQRDSISSGEQGGRGSLVIRTGRVYGLTRVQAGSQAFDEVFCLDAEKGSSIWRFRLPETGGKSAGSSTPCIAEDRIYVVGSGNKVYCLDATSGTPVWDASIARTGNEPIASSPAVAEGVIVVLADLLTGLDAKSGKLLWTQDKIAGHESSPARWSTEGHEYVICNTNQETHCVDPKNGAILWSVPGGGKSTPVVAQEYGGDFLINMSDSRKNGLTAYRLAPQEPRKLWTVRAFDRGSSPVVFDGHVYAIAGGSNGHGARMLCVHLDTGQVAWEEVIDFAEVSSPVIADGKLAAVCGTFLWLLQATPEKFSVLGQANCQITLCTSPAVFDGRLYLRQANSVTCYDLRSAP
jgi:outer membrane protein assembly factor BamB